MRRKIIITGDGSTTISLPDWEEQYHSKHGAIQEAYHVFIKSGLDLFLSHSDISILEMGFGTGLNCFITFLEAKKRHLKIKYEGVEAYPIITEELLHLNYIENLDAEEYRNVFNQMHEVTWDEWHSLVVNYKLKKRQQRFEEIQDKNMFDLIYFDAFGARVQPELWTEMIFSKMYEALKTNGVLVTYSAKGSVRRAMQSVGLKVERLPGPPGKREMLRATKV